MLTQDIEYPLTVIFKALQVSDKRPSVFQLGGPPDLDFAGTKDRNLPFTFFISGRLLADPDVDKEDSYGNLLADLDTHGSLSQLHKLVVGSLQGRTPHEGKCILQMNKAARLIIRSAPLLQSVQFVAYKIYKMTSRNIMATLFDGVTLPHLRRLDLRVSQDPTEDLLHVLRRHSNSLAKVHLNCIEGLPSSSMQRGLSWTRLRSQLLKVQFPHLKFFSMSFHGFIRGHMERQDYILHKKDAKALQEEVDRYFYRIHAKKEQRADERRQDHEQRIRKLSIYVPLAS